MLGKRTYDGRAPSFKKKKYTKSKNYAGNGPKQYGAGYNPKTISLRRPPPNSEVKWHDATGDNSDWTDVSTSAPCYHFTQGLNLIQIGENGDQRNGYKILATKLHLRFSSMVMTTSNTTFADTVPNDTYFRWMLILDTQCNGGVPTFAELFQNSPGGAELDFYNNLKETGRFKTLMDKYVRVPAAAPMFNGTTNHTHTPTRIIHCKKTFHLNLPIRYNDGTSSQGSVRSNNLFMIVMQGHSKTTLIRMQWRSRLRFTDY